MVAPRISVQTDDHGLCPGHDGAQPLAAAAARVHAASRLPPCVNEETDAATAAVLGLGCMNVATVAARGFFLVSLARSGAPVCTGGDDYHAWVTAVDGSMHFAALSVGTGAAHPHVYWMNTSATALHAGTVHFELDISLVQTQRRQLEPRPDPWRLMPLLRAGVCSWRRVGTTRIEVAVSAPAGSAGPEAQCGATPAASSLAYVALETDGCGGARLGRSVCTGDAAARVVNTSNAQRLRLRRTQGFGHALKPLGCRYHWYDESDLSRCLGGRTVLNIGSASAVDVQRGVARINSTLAAWTRRRVPTDKAEQRLPFRKRRPHVADFHYQFERTGGFNGRGPDLLGGQPSFGSGRFETMFIDHPPHYGLRNVLRPAEVAAKERGRVGFRDAAAYERFMCAHDVVVFESGVHDIALPFSGQLITYGPEKLRAACAARPVADCDLALRRATRGEDWRLAPYESYRASLAELTAMWSRCRSRRGKAFRPIFKLAPAARARQRPADCELAFWGHATQAHHVAEANRIAREAVEGAGFEVFDGFGVTLHALPRWFDDVRYGVRHKIHEAEATSDVLAQMLLNQLCNAAPPSAGWKGLGA